MTMTSQIQPPDAPGHPTQTDTLTVTVRYAAAPKPFQDHQVSRQETVQALKVRVLDTFGLSDGQSTRDGNTISYKLYHGKTELTDTGVTLGAIAGEAHALELKLSQHIQQGHNASSCVDRGASR